MSKTRPLIAASAVLLAALAANADPIGIYAEDFESGPVGPEWSANAVIDQAPPFSRFNGRYSGSAITLTLPAIQLRDTGGNDNNDDDSGNGGNGGGGGGDSILYTLAFDFYAIDSWDGYGYPYGPDQFAVEANSTEIFHEVFSNHAFGQDFRAPDVGPALLGFMPGWEDSIYRNITLDFTIPEAAQLLTISFHDLGLQGLNDESWGIDNVEVSYSVIPSPGSLALLGLGSLTLIRRKR